MTAFGDYSATWTGVSEKWFLRRSIEYRMPHDDNSAVDAHFLRVEAAIVRSAFADFHDQSRVLRHLHIGQVCYDVVHRFRFFTSHGFTTLVLTLEATDPWPETTWAIAMYRNAERDAILPELAADIDRIQAVNLNP